MGTSVHLNLLAEGTQQTVQATGVFSLTWLLIGLPLLGAAILLLGGRRTDSFGHLLGCATVLGSFVIGVARVRRSARPGLDGRARSTSTCSPGCLWGRSTSTSD